MDEALSQYATYEYDAHHKWVTFTWKKYAPSSEYRKVVQAGLEFAAAKKSAKLYNDCTLMGVVSPEDQKWLLDYLRKHSGKNGLRYVAVLVPKDVLAGISAQNIKNDLKVEIGMPDTRYFSNETEALVWLKSA